VKLIFGNLVLASGLPSAARVLDFFHERDGHKPVVDIRRTYAEAWPVMAVTKKSKACKRRRKTPLTGSDRMVRLRRSKNPAAKKLLPDSVASRGGMTIMKDRARPARVWHPLAAADIPIVRR
jgi:hypothetical protein